VLQKGGHDDEALQVLSHAVAFHVAEANQGLLLRKHKPDPVGVHATEGVSHDFV
jgi:hypothetical protein